MTAGKDDPRLGEEPEPVFGEPWEARAFAITMALCDRGLFSYEEFRQCLIGQINGPRASENYYVNWLSALESILADKGTLCDAELRDAVAALRSAAAAAPEHH